MKKILVSLLCAVMVVTFMPSMAFATDLQMSSDAENNQPQAGIENEQPQAEEGGGEQGGTAGTDQDAESERLQGNGTTESPYKVGTAEDLKFIAEKVNAGEAGYAKAVYQQTANIDLNGSADNQWKPIGTSDHKFTGTFIGTGYEITGLYIDNTELDNAGLFGHIVSPAKLEGITINGAKVNAKSNVGAIAGSAFTGSVKDCKVIGKINISGNYKVGGMFGGGYASITDSKVIAATGSTVTGIFKANDLEGDNVGGLIGFRGEGNIKTAGCSVTGVTVAGTRKVGGLIGSVFTNNIVEQCSVKDVKVICNASKEYGTSIVNSTAMVIGGMLGLYTANGNNDGTLKNCKVENITLEVENSELAAADKVTMGYVSGGQRGNKAPAETIAVENITVSGTNTGSNAEEKFPGSVAMNGEQKLFANGTGTAADPYIISSVDELKVFAKSVNQTGKTYKEQYVKVVDGMTFDLSGEKRTPIGTSTHKFMGTFDGNGATVKGLTTSFFGGVEDATIKNLKLADVNISDADQQGALLKGNTKDETTKSVSETCVGTITIDGIEVTGSISGSEKGDYIGSIMGGRATMEDDDIITIKNCVNRAKITGGAEAKIGGIIGYTNSSKGNWVIENCKNYGNITSELWAAGIAGGTTRVAVTSCVNEGKIQGAEVTGGIIGTANGGTTVKGCSNKGDVVDTKMNAGGIIGSSSSGGNIVSQSANTGNITGEMAAGGIIGGTGSQGDTIDNCYNGGNIKATGSPKVDGNKNIIPIAAGIYGYNNSTSPVKACVNDAKVEAPNGTAYHIGLSKYWYDQATGFKNDKCYYINEDGKIYAVAADGKDESEEQKNMTRTELAEILNEAGGVPNYWQAQNDSVQPDPIIPGALDEGRIAAIKDKDGNIIEGFASLEDAAEAAEDGQKIVLEENAILEDSLVIDGNRELTLDLNGKTLALKEGVNKTLIIVGDKTNGQDKTVLTLTDTASLKVGIECTASATGIFVSKGASMTTKNVNISFEDEDASAANIAIAVQGTLTVEKGTKIVSKEYGIGALADSKVVINGGEITAKYAAAGGNGTWQDTQMVINGGTLTSTESAAIYHPQSGKLTLNGGTIKGLTGVQMCAGELVIPENSTVKVTATGEDKRSDKDAGDGAIMDGAAISIVDRDYPGGIPKADISGGSFKAEHNKAVLAYTWNAKAEGEKHSEWKEAGEQIDISGGTYNTDVDKTLLKDGFEMVKGADGNYTVEDTTTPPYIPPTPTPQKPTIEAEEGATVTLSKDGTTATIVVDKDATLKDVLLNGQSLGAVTEVPNLKPGDKLVVIVETAEEKAERLTKGVENTTIKLYYKKGEIGKDWIKLRYKKSYGYKVDNYEIFRSAKKKTNFGKKAWFVTKTNKTKGFYKNSKSVKKGTRYYYKMRGVREIDGKKVYTKWSNIVMRTGR